MSLQATVHRKRKTLTPRASRLVLTGILLGALTVMLIAPCAPVVSPAVANSAITISTDCESPDHPVSTCPQAAEMHPSALTAQQPLASGIITESPLLAASTWGMRLAGDIDRGYPRGDSARRMPLRI